MADIIQYAAGLNDRVELPGYPDRHRTCPCCGEPDKYGQTVIGFIRGKDTNRVNCACGWSGTVHQLMPVDWSPFNG